MTQALTSESFAQRLVTVKGSECGNQSVLLLLPVGVNEGDAVRLVDTATQEANEATDNGYRDEFWRDWCARLSAAGFLVIGEVTGIPELTSMAWDKDTFTGTYLVCERWGHIFAGKSESMTRWALALAHSESGTSDRLVSAQVQGSLGWSDLDPSVCADLLKSINDNLVQVDPAQFDAERTNQLPAWVKRPIVAQAYNANDNAVGIDEEPISRRPAYIVSEVWSHIFFGESASDTRFVLSTSGSGSTLVHAQIAGDNGEWSNLDRVATAHLLESLIENEVDKKPQDHGVITSDTLPEWAQACAELARAARTARSVPRG